jgi:hypothetical protein
LIKRRKKDESKIFSFSFLFMCFWIYLKFESVYKNKVTPQFCFVKIFSIIFAKFWILCLVWFIFVLLILKNFVSFFFPIYHIDSLYLWISCIRLLLKNCPFITYLNKCSFENSSLFSGLLRNRAIPELNQKIQRLRSIY